MMLMREKCGYIIIAPPKRQEVGQTSRAVGVGQIIAAEFDYRCSSQRGDWKTKMSLSMTEKVQFIFLFLLLGHCFAHKFNLRDV